MTICYFGDFDPDYSRQRVLIKGLRLNGVEVLICNSRKKGRAMYRELRNVYKSLPNHDLVLVGYSSNRWIVPFAKFLSRKPIIWDAFFSIYENWVFDRKLVKPRSLKAQYYWFLDWFSCVLADLVLLDTNSNIEYFRKTFWLKNKKFLRVFVGTDDTVMYPRDVIKKTHQFIVELHSNYIPVHGVECAIRAAKILESHPDIKFNLIGDGQEFMRLTKLALELELKNLEFINPVPYEELPLLMSEADVCLGLLSNVDRGARAIPNKVYEASAMKRPTIHMDGLGIRELYTDHHDILLFKGGDPQDLADKILELKNDPELRLKISENAYQTFRKNGTPEVVAKTLIDSIGHINFYKS